MVVYISGGVHMGDQLMMVEGRTLIGVPLQRAQQMLSDAYKSKKVRKYCLIRGLKWLSVTGHNKGFSEVRTFWSGWQ